MTRLTSKYLLLAALPLLACDDGPSLDLADATTGDASARAASDVRVVIFETREPVRALTVSPARAEATAIPQPEPVTAASTIEAAAADESEAAPDVRGRWLVDGGRLVLAQGEAVDATWSTGPATLVAAGDPKGDGLFVATREVVPSALPADLTVLYGAEVKVYDREREVCVARVAGSDGYRIEAQLVHLPSGWADEGPEIAPTHEADEVFSLGLTTLAAELVPLIGDCAGGVWAVPLAAPTPVLFREAALARALQRRAIAAFRTLPAWRAAQHDMLHFWDGGEAPSGLRGQRWDTLFGTRPEATLYRSHDGRRELVVVQADSHDGCGSEGQRVVSLFELVKTGKGDEVRFVELTSMSWAEVPRGLVDLEGDGEIEIFAGRYSGNRALGTRLERWHGERPAPSDVNGWNDERYEPLHTLEVPDITEYGCSC